MTTRPIRGSVPVLLALLLAAWWMPAPAAAQATGGADAIDIPYERFVLPNGLTLIVHEDHKAPIVAVNVWYHVGSKNEKPGKTGFAHLFEHLMFNGSENHPGEYFAPFERVGATDMNGTTNQDRTNYFQNVPVGALDLALWMESDRMGHMLGAVDQKTLDEQRGVVQNEKREGENQPYGRVWDALLEGSYPAGHPYRHSVIGSMEDLNAASLEDVHEWFRTYYGPNNAVLVVAGDVDPQVVKQKVEHYFGAIPPGPPIRKHEAWVAKRTGEHREVMQDRVPQARIYKVWNIPEYRAPELIHLDLVSDVLGAGKTSRLYKRLVYDDQLATDVAAYINSGEIGSRFLIVATAKPGQELAALEQAIDEELARFLAEGPTPAELARVKTGFRSNFIQGIERIGGFGGKSDVLAMSEVFGGSPDFYKVRLQRAAEATAADLQRTAREWLADGAYVLEVVPYPQLAAAGTDADRSKLPDVSRPAKPEFPSFRTATLSNGLKLVVAERRTVPVVQFALLVDAGYAADQFATPGTAALAMNMLDEGTKSRSALEIAEELGQLGAELSVGSSLDNSYVRLSVLRENVDRALELYADVILNPAFPEADLQRLKAQQLAGIQREKSSPMQVALRVFPRLLYGEGHAYGNPMTGSGTEASVRALGREDLVRFHQTWFRPNNATLIVVGATSLDEIQPKLERLFRGWRAGEVPQKNLASVEPRASAVYLIDRPGAPQSFIMAGHLVAPKANPDEVALGTANYILGGNFNSRLNMNLREDKHWSYGARTLIFDARGQRPFIAYAGVQSDRTKESLAEVLKELRGIIGANPPTADELQRARSGQTLTLPGRWETNRAVLGSLDEIVTFGLPADYWSTYADRVNALELEQVRQAARQLVHPEHVIWVVVGDREKIEAGVRELGLGEVHLIDADGNPVVRTAAGD